MSALQQAIDAIDLHATDDERGQLIAAKCRGLMHGYDARWRDAGWQTVSVEEEFQLPVVNPQTGRASRLWKQAGKFDGIITYGGQNYLLEHKTTSEDVSDPDAPYWRRLAIDSQVSTYVLANWQAGRALHGTVYDVIRKPNIAPRKLSKADRANIVANGLYYGGKVPDYIRTEIAAGDDRECTTLYALRLASDTKERPEWYFQRQTIPRLDHEVMEWVRELWDVSQEISNANRLDRHYRNSDSCMQYNSPCQFLGICSGHDNPDSGNWVQRANVHPELNVDDSRGILTNSRIRCFQSCRRKHFFRYQLGLERRDEEEKEALYFGSLLHCALEAWWLFFLESEDNHDNGSKFAVNEAANIGQTSQGVAG